VVAEHELSKLSEKMRNVIIESLRSREIKVEDVAVWWNRLENAEELIVEFTVPLSETMRLYYEGAYEECADADNVEGCVRDLKARFRHENCEIEVFKFHSAHIKAYTMVAEGEFGGEYYYCYPALRMKISRVLYPYLVNDLLSDEAKLREFAQSNIIDQTVQILNTFKQLQSIT